MPTEADTPSWFIADSSLASVGEKREQAARAGALQTLQQIFPTSPVAQLRSAIDAGGNLTTIVDRLLALQVPDPSEAGSSTDVIAPGGGPRPRRVRFADAGPSSAGGAFSAAPPSQVEQMVFDGGKSHFGGGPSVAADGAPLGGTGSMDRMSGDELADQMSSSGMNADPTVGSARGLGRDAGREGGDATLGGALRSGSANDLGGQSLAQLAGGALDVATIASLAAGAGEGIADAFSTPANAELGAISTLFATMAKTPYTWGDQVTLTMKLDTQPHIVQDLPLTARCEFPNVRRRTRTA